MNNRICCRAGAWSKQAYGERDCESPTDLNSCTRQLAQQVATQARPLKAEEMPVAARAIPGPSRADMEAASQLPKGQQDAMIEGMVASLEAKLKADPSDVDRWIMLMRSRMTLGETAKAAQALKDGVAANPAAAARIKAQARMLGVPGT